MKDKKIIKEVSTNTEIVKTDDNPLLKDIKKYFKEKEKDIEFVNYDSVGDVVTIDLRFKFNEDEIMAPNDPTMRTDARQQAYDVKRKLEEYLFKTFNISVLSIQGLIMKSKTVEFEISFIYKNTGNFKVEYTESTNLKNKEKALKEGSKYSFNGKEIEITKVEKESIEFLTEGKTKKVPISFFKSVLKEYFVKGGETLRDAIEVMNFINDFSEESALEEYPEDYADILNDDNWERIKAEYELKVEEIFRRAKPFMRRKLNDEQAAQLDELVYDGSDCYNDADLYFEYMPSYFNNQYETLGKIISEFESQPMIKTKNNMV